MKRLITMFLLCVLLCPVIMGNDDGEGCAMVVLLILILCCLSYEHGLADGTTWEIVPTGVSLPPDSIIATMSYADETLKGKLVTSNISDDKFRVTLNQTPKAGDKIHVVLSDRVARRVLPKKIPANLSVGLSLDSDFNPASDSPAHLTVQKWNYGTEGLQSCRIIANGQEMNLHTTRF